MPNKPSNAEIVKMILDGMANDEAEEEDLIHLLIENKVSKNVQRRSRESLTMGERVVIRLPKPRGAGPLFSAFAAYWRSGSYAMPYCLQNLLTRTPLFF
jgi:hypothetical protein